MRLRLKDPFRIVRLADAEVHLETYRRFITIERGIGAHQGVVPELEPRVHNFVPPFRRNVLFGGMPACLNMVTIFAAGNSS